MTRLRVHELAKELNIDNKDLIDRIEKLGFQVKNHMSPLTENAVLKIRQQFSEARLGAEKVEEKRIGREVIRRRKKIDPSLSLKHPRRRRQKNSLLKRWRKSLKSRPSILPRLIYNPANPKSLRKPPLK